MGGTATTHYGYLISGTLGICFIVFRLSSIFSHWYYDVPRWPILWTLGKPQHPLLCQFLPYWTPSRSSNWMVVTYNSVFQRSTLHTTNGLLPRAKVDRSHPHLLILAGLRQTHDLNIYYTRRHNYASLQVEIIPNFSNLLTPRDHLEAIWYWRQTETSISICAWLRAEPPRPAVGCVPVTAYPRTKPNEHEIPVLSSLR